MLLTISTLGSPAKHLSSIKTGTTIAHYDEEQVINMFNAIESSKEDLSYASLAQLKKQMLEGHKEAAVIHIMELLTSLVSHPLRDWIGI